VRIFCYSDVVSRNKTYGDSCGVARALDAVGERWALLVVRDLLLGPKRYTDLQSGLPGVSPNVLSARLRELIDAGVVTQRRLPPPVAGQVYELTEWGRGLEPVLLGLGVWGSDSPIPPAERPLGMDSLILAIRTRLSPATADAIAATIQLEVDDDVITLIARDGRVRIRRGETDAPDAILSTGAATLEEVIFGGRALKDALRRGELTVTGDADAVRRLVSTAAG
jgi:DNA-binding HxlR family transcriptional regulator